MKKYTYLVNNKEVKRKEFIGKLQGCCLIVTDRSFIGDLGITFCEVDLKKFNKCMRSINQGVEVVFIDERKSFSRKEIK